MALGQLTKKQALFAAEYAKDHNGMQAAIRAGYSPKTAGEQAFRLLKKAEITARVEQTFAKALKKEEMTVHEVMHEYARIARSDASSYYNEDGTLKPLSSLSEEARRAISEIEIKESADGKLRGKIKLHSKIAALDALAKIFKLWAPDAAPERQVLIQFLNVPAPKYAQVADVTIPALESGETSESS
jgi:phage terminase small subunit